MDTGAAATASARRTRSACAHCRYGPGHRRSGRTRRAGHGRDRSARNPRAAGSCCCGASGAASRLFGAAAVPWQHGYLPIEAADRSGHGDPVVHERLPDASVLPHSAEHCRPGRLRRPTAGSGTIAGQCGLRRSAGRVSAASTARRLCRHHPQPDRARHPAPTSPPRLLPRPDRRDKHAANRGRDPVLPGQSSPFARRDCLAFSAWCDPQHAARVLSI